jgi:hypothetical protein
VAPVPPGVDAEGMFESRIGPGVRSDRFGTWSLITFLILFFAPAIGDLTLGWWLPLLACGGATVGALGFGVVGLFIRDQRRQALHGLLKAAVPTLAGGAFLLLLLALSSMNFE